MTTSETALELLARLGAGATPNEIAQLFTLDVDWNIPGDTTAFPWVGKKTGHEAIKSFVRDTRRLLEPVRFDVEGIFTDEQRAVILGSLASKVKATSKTIETSFAIVLRVAEGGIASFTMLEDSFAVSLATKD
jgi:ketosteroid isomerase-like protein